MIIEIYKIDCIYPAEVWHDYPVVPRVGDDIKLKNEVTSKKVKTRVFCKDKVKLIVEG